MGLYTPGLEGTYGMYVAIGCVSVQLSRSVTARLTLRGGAGARGGGVWTWRSSLENLVWYQGSGVVPSSRSNFPQPHVLYLALHKHDQTGREVERRGSRTLCSSGGQCRVSGCVAQRPRLSKAAAGLAPPPGPAREAARGATQPTRPRRRRRWLGLGLGLGLRVGVGVGVGVGVRVRVRVRVRFRVGWLTRRGG